MIRIDHIGIAARNARESAQALAQILGAPEPIVDGADNDMYRVDLDHGASLLFSTSETVRFEHIAFQVDRSRFIEVVTRLRQREMQFSNDPEDVRNGSTDEEVFLKELKKMSQMHGPGSRELLDDAERLDDLLVSRASVERRLRGLSPEERLHGLAPEDVLRGLTPAKLARLRELLLKSDGR